MSSPVCYLKIKHYNNSKVLNNHKCIRSLYWKHNSRTMILKDTIKSSHYFTSCLLCPLQSFKKYIQNQINLIQKRREARTELLYLRNVQFFSFNFSHKNVLLTRLKNCLSMLNVICVTFCFYFASFYSFFQTFFNT